MYNAFVSYSHAADNRLAPALQSAVRRFATPWYRKSRLQIFRDQTDLSVSPGLWSAIETALSNSQYLVLLASPRAANSKWVRRELTYWLAHNEPASLLVVLTEGTIAWSETLKDFDWHGTSALPDSLAGVFVEEPLYLDLSSISRSQDVAHDNPAFRDAVASLAAALLGRPKSELIGDDIALRRRTRQTAWAVGAVLASLTVLLAASTRFAISQRDALAKSLQVVQGQKLAAEAQLVRARSPNQLQVSALLGLEAARLAPSAALESQLRQTVALLLPPLKQFDLPGGSSPADVVTSIAFSPDGLSLAAVGVGAAPRWLDIATGHAHRDFSADKNAMAESVVAFTPDASQLVTATLTGVDSWNASDGRLQKHEASPFGAIRTLALSPDGKYTAIGYLDGAVRVVERESGRVIMQGKHDIVVNAIAFSPDGTLVASGSNDNSVRIWSLASGREVRRLASASGILSVAFSPDGKSLATAGWEGLARVWDLSTGRESASFDHRSVINAVAFSTDGARLATAGADATTRVWDRITGTEVARATDDAAVTAIQFSPDGRHLATAAGRTVTLWATAYGDEIVQLRHPDDIVASVGFSADAKRLITAAADSARVWRLSDGKELYRLKHESAVEDALFSADDSVVETLTKPEPTANGSTCAHLWAAASRVLQYSLCPGLSSMAFNQDGSRIAFVDSRGQVDVQAFQAGAAAAAPTRVEGLGKADFTSPIATGGHRYVAVASDENEVHRLHVADAEGKNPGTMSLAARANQMAFSADERLIAVGTEGGAELWETATGRKLGAAALTEGVQSVAFSIDGKYLATGGGDQSVRVWETPGFNEVARFYMGGAVNRVTFSPDMALLAAASSDRTARVWQWRADPTKTACGRLRRNLTLAEWRTYMGEVPYHATCPALANPAEDEAKAAAGASPEAASH